MQTIAEGFSVCGLVTDVKIDKLVALFSQQQLFCMMFLRVWTKLRLIS